MNNDHSSVRIIWLFTMLILGLILSVALGIGASSFFHPLLPSRINIQQGETLFQQRCAACHSVLSEEKGGMGPNLSSIGQLASSRVDGQSAEQYILESIMEPERYRAEGSLNHMPSGTVAGLDSESVRSIVGYLIGTGGSVDETKILELKISTEIIGKEHFVQDIDQLKHGWNLFNNKLGCSACHSYLELPGDNLRAPSLARIGQYSDEHILNSIKSPNASIASQWRSAEIDLVNGLNIHGRIVERTDDEISLLMQNKLGRNLLEIRIVKISEVKELRISEISPMPAYTLTIRDEQAILAFLRSLNTTL